PARPALSPSAQTVGPRRVGQRSSRWWRSNHIRPQRRGLLASPSDVHSKRMLPMAFRIRLRLAWSVPLLALLLAVAPLSAQGRRGGGPPAEIINKSDNPVLASFRFREIGPASMGGRIDDIEIAP